MVAPDFLFFSFISNFLITFFIHYYGGRPEIIINHALNENNHEGYTNKNYMKKKWADTKFRPWNQVHSRYSTLRQMLAPMGAIGVDPSLVLASAITIYIVQYC